MIILSRGLEFTNSYRPKEWELKVDGFRKSNRQWLAYWGEQQDNKVMFPVATGFDPDKPSKCITTMKGTKMLVNCQQNQDEKILMAWIRGGFRGLAPIVVAIHDAEIIWVGEGNAKHCAPNYPIVFRIAGPEPVIYAEINGRRMEGGQIIRINPLNGIQKIVDKIKVLEVVKSYDKWNIHNWVHGLQNNVQFEEVKKIFGLDKTEKELEAETPLERLKRELSVK